MRPFGQKDYLLIYVSEGALIYTIDGIEKKVSQARNASGIKNIMAYREDDLSFILIAKDSVVYQKLNLMLSDYHEFSGHKYKSFHEFQEPNQ